VIARRLVFSEIWALRASLRYPIVSLFLFPGLIALWLVPPALLSVVLWLIFSPEIGAFATELPTFLRILWFVFAGALFVVIAPPVLGILWTATMLVFGRPQRAHDRLAKLTRWVEARS